MSYIESLRIKFAQELRGQAFTDAIGPQDLGELEDILYGLQNYSELRPSPSRISTLRTVSKENPIIKEMLGIWESGHGVLSKPDRVEALTRLLERLG